jgi:hypothetical protein
MAEHSKTVRLKVAKWYVKNLLKIEQGFNVHFEWPKGFPDNECLMTMTCFSDYPMPQFRKTKDDLESYLVRKFGNMIIEDGRKPRNMDLSAASKGIPLKHPLLKQDKKDYPSYSDSFKEEYELELTKQELLEANSTFKTQDMRLRADKVKQIAGYESDIYRLRIGKWQ